MRQICTVARERFSRLRTSFTASDAEKLSKVLVKTSEERFASRSRGHRTMYIPLTRFLDPRPVGRSVGGFSSKRDATRNKRALCPSKQRGEREREGGGERDGMPEREEGTERARELYRPTSLIQHPSYGAVGSSCS